MGSDDSDSESSAVVSPKHGSSEEDSNVVYNRICHALQSLITEAQSALMRSSSLSPSMEKQQCRMDHKQRQITHTSEGTTQSTNHLGLFVDEHTYLDHCNHFSCRPSRRNSLTHGRIDKTLLYPSPPSITSSSSSRSVYSTSSELSRILWIEKQQEQYDRYRRSCDMVSLELQLLLNDSAFDSDQSDTSALSSSSTKANSSGHTASSTTTPRSAVSSHKRSKDGTESKAEKLQRRYQVQFLNPNIQRRQRDGGSYKPRDRHYKNQGVGASRSQSILMQLYDLWKHTWLRNRFMHVLTSSVEVLVILLIVIKVSQVSLTWMGVSLDKSQNLLTYIYGHRQGAGAAAKELYGKIRRDGLRFTQIRLRQLYPETEALVQDMLLGDKPPTPFTPAGMVLGPAKRMLAHTVAGVALAYVSENARHVAMML